MVNKRLFLEIHIILLLQSKARQVHEELYYFINTTNKHEKRNLEMFTGKLITQNSVRLNRTKQTQCQPNVL